MAGRFFRELLPIAMIIIVSVFGYSKIDKMPDNIAIHFDSKGQPDNWMPKRQAMLLLPAIYLIAYLMLTVWTLLMPAMFPWKVLMVALMCNAHISTVYYAMGKIRSILWSMTPSFALLLIYTVYVFITIRSR